MLNKIIVCVSVCLITTGVIAQTCNTSIAQSTPTERFMLQSDGTVLDKKTNLIWKRCSEGQIWDGANCNGNTSTYTWQQALSLSQGNWRIPNIKELSSIVEISCYSPAINLTIFPDASSGSHRTSSLVSNGGSSVWSVSFNLGGSSGGLKSYNERVRLVRSGQ